MNRIFSLIGKLISIFKKGGRTKNGTVIAPNAYKASAISKFGAALKQNPKAVQNLKNMTPEDRAWVYKWIINDGLAQRYMTAETYVERLANVDNAVSKFNSSIKNLSGAQKQFWKTMSPDDTEEIYAAIRRGEGSYDQMMRFIRKKTDGWLKTPEGKKWEKSYNQFIGYPKPGGKPLMNDPYDMMKKKSSNW